MGRTACTEPQCLYKGDLYLYIFTFHKVYILLKRACTMEAGFNIIVNYNPGCVHNYMCDIFLLVITIGTHIYH